MVVGATVVLVLWGVDGVVVVVGAALVVVGAMVLLVVVVVVAVVVVVGGAVVVVGATVVVVAATLVLVGARSVVGVLGSAAGSPGVVVVVGAAGTSPGPLVDVGGAARSSSDVSARAKAGAAVMAAALNTTATRPRLFGLIAGRAAPHTTAPGVDPGEGHELGRRRRAAVGDAREPASRC